MAAGAYSCWVLLPEVIASVRREAPLAEVRVHGAGSGLAEELDAGRADVAVGSFTAIPDRFDSLPLFEEELVWGLRADHPLADQPFTMDTLCSVPRIVISTAEDGQVVDGAVTDGGLERRVIWDDGGVVRRACQERGLRPPPAYFTPDPHSALAFLSAGDMAALIPKRLAQMYAPMLGIRLFDPPYAAKSIPLVMLWRKDHDAAALAWLRDLIVRAAANLAVA